MKLQQLYSYVRKAVDDYKMIDEGDKIAVGISGGKDSLTLLYALAGLRRFYPKKFTIVAVTVDLGYPDFDLSSIQDLCKELDVEYHIVKTQIGEIVTQERKENSPCSLCSKMRKGALNDYINQIGCNKLAYAHHMDDMVETMMLSLIFEGRLHTFSPVTYWDKSNITLIRPLMYVPEVDVIGFKNKYLLPCVKNPCPVDGSTKREEMKELVKQIHKQYPGAKQRMFTAILNGEIY